MLGDQYARPQLTRGQVGERHLVQFEAPGARVHLPGEAVYECLRVGRLGGHDTEELPGLDRKIEAVEPSVGEPAQP